MARDASSEEMEEFLVADIAPAAEVRHLSFIKRESERRLCDFQCISETAFGSSISILKQMQPDSDSFNPLESPLLCIECRRSTQGKAKSM